MGQDNGGIIVIEIWSPGTPILLSSSYTLFLKTILQKCFSPESSVIFTSGNSSIDPFIDCITDFKCDVGESAAVRKLELRRGEFCLPGGEHSDE